MSEVRENGIKNRVMSPNQKAYAPRATPKAFGTNFESGGQQKVLSRTTICSRSNLGKGSGAAACRKSLQALGAKSGQVRFGRTSGQSIFKEGSLTRVESATRPLGDSSAL